MGGRIVRRDYPSEGYSVLGGLCHADNMNEPGRSRDGRFPADLKKKHPARGPRPTKGTIQLLNKALATCGR